MATQFSLSYDSAGNASLVENKIASKPAITGKFDIDPYAPVRSVSTDYSFTPANQDTFDYENQLIYLEQFIKDNDSDVDKEFKDDSFETLAAKDDKGNIIGDLTFVEKAKIAAFNYANMPTFAKLAISAFTPFGFLGTIANFASERMLDDYYNPKNPMYDYTGFGAVTGGADDRIEDAGGVMIDNEYTYGTDYQGDDKPSDVNAKNKAFAQVQNQIGQSLHGSGGNQGSGGHAGGQSAADAAASQAADDRAAGAGGY